MAVSSLDTHNPPSTAAAPVEIHSVRCESCGFTEECTFSYILRVRERYQGRWICGLCIEAVKDEALRSDALISTKEALDRHIRFCNKFRASSPCDETEHPISAMGRILRRSLDSGGVLTGFEGVSQGSISSSV